jgi:putative Mg2+ transporter-C (MgtC) family protein
MRTLVPEELLVHFDLWTVVLRIGLAAVLSGIIGWERERLRKPAGFRTHILVGVGSCLVMLVSLYVPVICPWSNVDPGRIAAQVVVGIGFLGAGTILRQQGGVVSGLTTAASLWVVSGLGLAIGIGFFSAALTAWAVVIIVLFALNRFDQYIEHHLYHDLIVQGRFTIHTLEEVKSVLRTAGVSVLQTEFEHAHGVEKILLVHVRPVNVSRRGELSHILLKVKGVREVLFQS